MRRELARHRAAPRSDPSRDARPEPAVRAL